MSTRCDYCVFGENRSANSLTDALGDFWRELYKRDPDGIRSRARPPNHSGMWPFDSFISTDGLKGSRDFPLHKDLWVSLRIVNRQDLERTCRRILQKLGRSPSDFVIYDFPDARMFPNDPLYAALVREFKQLQDRHQTTRMALQEAVATAPEALGAFDLAEASSTQHGPIGTFLRIKDKFKRVADASGDGDA